ALVIPVEHKAGPFLAALALGLAVPGRWSTNAVAVIALAGSDAAAGRIVPFRRVHLRRRRTWRPGSAAVGAWMRLTVRALPTATVAASMLLPAAFIAFGYLI